jgi:hypothetical protein
MASKSPNPNKKARTDLPLKDRFEVIKLSDQKLTQVEIAKRMGCSQGQVSRILKNREDILQRISENCDGDRKRQRTGKEPEVQSALKTWFRDSRVKNAPINQDLLAIKAKEFAGKMDKPDFTPSNGWISR